jgi:CubicO group peptidase (beta-lactamase class C family)
VPSSLGAKLQADAGRRALLRFCVAAAGAAVLPACGAAAERGAWGEDQGYPSGWGPPGQPPRWEAYPAYRVGNFSGGFERMFRHTVLRSGRSPSALRPSGRSLAYDPQSHVRAWPVTGLLIARDGEILFESYAMGRSAEMRMTGWSMSKSVTSLLFGIALDRGIVRDLDDTPERYVPSLAGTLHGRIAFRHLLNMSSGAEVDHARDPVRIDVPALLGPPHARATGTDVERVLRAWDGVREPPGTRFNYNELCPLVIGMTLRHVTGDTLARFAEEALWHPLGAEADATWLADSLGREYNCVGFAARLRDWARLGQMIAQRGRMGDRQVVSAAYIESCRSWGPQERQVAHGVARSDTGYRNFFWHPRRDGRWMVMNGAHGQRLAVDVETRTVMVQTAVAAEGAWSRDFYALFETAIRG